MNRFLRALPTLASLVVGIASFALSYVALRDVAASIDAVPAYLAWLVPVVIDGGVLCGSAVIWATSRDGEGRQFFPFLFVAVLVVVSVVVNTAHAGPDPLAKAIAALPPLVLLGSLELVAAEHRRLTLIERSKAQQDVAIAPAAAAPSETSPAPDRVAAESAASPAPARQRPAEPSREPVRTTTARQEPRTHAATAVTSAPRQADARPQVSGERVFVPAEPRTLSAPATSNGNGNGNGTAKVGSSNGVQVLDRPTSSSASSPAAEKAAPLQSSEPQRPSSQPPTSGPSPAPREDARSSTDTADTADTADPATDDEPTSAAEAHSQIMSQLPDPDPEMPKKEQIRWLFEQFIDDGGERDDPYVATAISKKLDTSRSYVSRTIRDLRAPDDGS